MIRAKLSAVGAVDRSYPGCCGTSATSWTSTRTPSLWTLRLISVSSTGPVTAQPARGTATANGAHVCPDRYPYPTHLENGDSMTTFDAVQALLATIDGCPAWGLIERVEVEPGIVRVTSIKPRPGEPIGPLLRITEEWPLDPTTAQETQARIRAARLRRTATR